MVNALPSFKNTAARPLATSQVLSCLVSPSGNKYIHAMTKDKSHILRVEVENWEGEHRFAEWTEFSVGDENSK